MPVVEIISKTCQDCYRCLRKCPVHAITVRDGHARVVTERCLYCGQCVRECPRHAIRVRRSVKAVKAMIASGVPVIASVSLMESSRVSPVVAELVPELLRLGFAGAEATTRALRPVWERYRAIAREADHLTIASGCPAVVTLVERFYPEAIPLLAPIVSHAEAHARIIKARARARGRDDVKVVHIGPEPAVKGEVRRSREPMALDAALTLREARRWIRSASKSGQMAPAVAHARLQVDDTGPPLEWVRDILPIYGPDECVDFLNRIPKGIPRGTVVEMATCRYGCAIGSPRVLARVFEATAYLYAEGSGLAPCDTEDWSGLDLTRSFRDRRVKRASPTEQQITDILRQMGMRGPDDELNCGACGYHSCREMAVAVFEGMAETAMCMPHVTRQAHRISLILRYTANGVLLVDHGMRVRFANPAFRRMFHCENEPVEERPVEELLHNDMFQQALVAGGMLAVRGRVAEHDLAYRAQIFPIEGEQLLASVIVDISREAKANEEFQRVREITLDRAQEVINRQMKTAQEIAGLLGETTAETKALLVKLMDLARREPVK